MGATTEIRNKKGTENSVADYLSHIEQLKTHLPFPPVNEEFPDEQLLLVKTAPWNTRPIGPLSSSIWTKRLPQKIKLCNLMSWKNSDMKPTTTKKSTRKRPRSGMTRKSKGECLNQVSPYGHAKIQNDKDGTKFVVNCQRLKQYLSEEQNLHQPTPPQD
ncbi:hypothetical protein PIB30_082157 [Stylosanthes scabra]|uniref:Uncharacterized protein n=1 Tax=Stylosanthes scabra TaxID=79078 RepID=A0ABU6XQL4_9FABA|nr:hypothetical protein [Stylosanthes scabra]